MAEGNSRERIMAELYREEVLTHTAALADGLLAWERLTQAGSGASGGSSPENTGGNAPSGSCGQSAGSNPPDSIVAQGADPAFADSAQAGSAAGAGLAGVPSSAPAAGCSNKEIDADPLLASLMRATHSLKGAAKIMHLAPVADVTHALEAFFVQARDRRAALSAEAADVLLGIVDFLQHSAVAASAAGRQEWLAAASAEASRCIAALRELEGQAAFAKTQLPSSESTADAAAGDSGVPASSVPPPAAALPQPAHQPDSFASLDTAASAAQLGAEAAATESADGSVLTAATGGLTAAADNDAVRSAVPVHGSPSATAAGSRGRESLAAAAGEGGAVLRIGAQTLDELLRLGVQGRLLRRRLDQLPAAFQALNGQQLALLRALDNCATQLARMGIGGQERNALLAPLRAEAARLHELQRTLREQSAACAQEQALLSERWYTQVVASRLRPFADIASGFPRLVRDLGRTLGKRVQLRIEGAAALADREILEQLEAPLVHLLRNACVHGLELPAERIAAGKREQGEVALSVTHSEGWLLLRVADDGRGIDTAAVRALLVEKGFLAAGQAVSDDEILEYLFASGFSTAQAVDALAGRGVGLDAVRTRVRELGGQVSLATEVGKGTVFTLRVPVTRALLSVLCVRLAGEPYALPLGDIGRVVFVNAEEAARGECIVDGAPLPILSLAQMLDVGTAEQCVYGNAEGHSAAWRPSSFTASTAVLMVVLQVRGRRLCVLDAGRVEDEFELAIQSPDSRLGDVPLLLATGQNELGEVVLVLNGERLAARAEEMLAEGAAQRLQSSHVAPMKEGAAPVSAASSAGAATTPEGSAAQRENPPRALPVENAVPAVAGFADSAVAGDANDGPDKTPSKENTGEPIVAGTAKDGAALPRLRVLLAEDSAAARARVAEVLADAGNFTLVTVSDGAQAWELLERKPADFDLLLTDLDMPELDGCGLVARLRAAGGRLAALPVVMFSAEDSAASRQRGLAAGANRFLGKSVLGNDPEAFVAALRKTAQGA